MNKENIEISDELTRVLIIDDNTTYRIMIKKIIEMYFYAQVFQAENPKDAFIIIPKIKPNLIFLDMQMPFMDGFTALKHIRNMPETAHTPVIAFSALGNETLLAELVKYNISDYIKKPANTDTIISKISPFLQPKKEYNHDR